MNRPRPAWRWGAFAIVATGAIAFSFFLFHVGPSSSPADLTLAPGEAGLRAAVDPETGELAVGADAMRLQGEKAVDRELRESLSRSDEGLVKVVRPDGHATVYLEGRFMNTSVARVTPDGEVETLCTHDANEAEDFLAGKPKPAPEVDAYGREVR